MTYAERLKLSQTIEKLARLTEARGATKAAPHSRIYTSKAPQVMQLFVFVLQLRKQYGATIQFDYAVFSKHLWAALSSLTDKSHYTTAELKAHGGQGKKTPYTYLLGRVSPEDLKAKYALVMAHMPKDPNAMGLIMVGKGDFTRVDVSRACDKQEGRCAGCGCLINEETAQGDHIHAKQKGGSNKTVNLQAMCQPCNASKGKKSMKAWNAWKVKHGIPVFVLLEPAQTVQGGRSAQKRQKRTQLVTVT